MEVRRVLTEAGKAEEEAMLVALPTTTTPPAEVSGRAAAPPVHSARALSTADMAYDEALADRPRDWLATTAGARLFGETSGVKPMRLVATPALSMTASSSSPTSRPSRTR